jgi:hypothetical protein
MRRPKGSDLYILCNGIKPDMKDKFATTLDLEAYQNHGMNCKKILPILGTHFEVRIFVRECVNCCLEDMFKGEINSNNYLNINIFLCQPYFMKDYTFSQ